MAENIRQAELINIHNSILQVAMDISARLSGPLFVAEFDAVVNKAIESLGILFQADRAYVFTIYESGDLENTHEWCAEGISSVILRNRNLSMKSFPWWEKKLSEMQPIHIEDIESLPSEAGNEKKRFSGQGIKSMLCLPIAGSKGKPGGFMGFETLSASIQLKKHQVALLKIIAEIIANAMDRRRMSEELEKIQAQNSDK